MDYGTVCVLEDPCSKGMTEERDLIPISFQRKGLPPSCTGESQGILRTSDWSFCTLAGLYHLVLKLLCR